MSPKVLPEERNAVLARDNGENTKSLFGKW